MKTTIISASQYHTALAKIERLMEKGFGRLTNEQTAELKTLSASVAAYEKTKYPMPLYLSIADILIYHMQQENLTQAAFSKKLGISNSAMSDFINGKKKPNLAIVTKLHEKLNIDGNLLLKISS